MVQVLSMVNGLILTLLAILVFVTTQRVFRDKFYSPILTLVAEATLHAPSA